MPNRLFTPVTGLLALCSLMVVGLDATWASCFALERHTLMQGELWRLWTGHFVHYSAQHAWVNVLVFAVTGNIIERYLGTLKFAVVILCSAAIISAGLVLWQARLAEYRGLSAIATMLTITTLYVVSQQHRAATIYVVLLGFFLSGKLLSEALGLSIGSASLPDGVVIEWRAHVLGAVAGLVLIGWLVLVEKTGCRTPKYGHLQTV